MKEKVFRFIDSKRDEMLALWQNLVNMESGTGISSIGWTGKFPKSSPGRT